MARFLHGLNREIQDIVEFHDYTSLSTFVNQATKVELQLKGMVEDLTLKQVLLGRVRKEEKDKPRREKSPKKDSAPSHTKKRGRMEKSRVKALKKSLYDVCPESHCPWRLRKLLQRPKVQ
ncbi:hypothetical protein CR513_33128, partial [Mucuna pruriens]